MECSVDVCYVCLVYSIKSSVFLLILCLVVLSVVESRILKSPTVTAVLLSTFPSVHFCFRYFGALLLGVYKFIMVLPLWWIGSVIVV